VKSLRFTTATKFHIDFGWWDKQNKDIRVFMRDLLCAECKERLAAQAGSPTVDMIDPETAEVTKVDVLWEAIRACCSKTPSYLTPDTPMLDGIFRVLLANGNKPLSVQQLHERLDKKPADMMLRMLTRGQVYLGIKPVE
jgi:hypothetical protein